MATADAEFFEFKNNIPEINKNFNELLKTLNKFNSTLGTVTRSQDRYTESNNRLEDSVSDTDEKVEKVNKSHEKSISVYERTTKAMSGLSAGYKTLWSYLSPLSLSAIGLSFNMSSLMSAAYAENKAISSLGDNMTYLSTETGSVSGAVNMLHKAAGQSTLSIASMSGVLKALSDQGIDSQKDFLNLSKIVGNFQVATGVAGAGFSNFVGELSFRYGATAKGIERISSSLIATGATATTLEKIIGSVNKVLNNTIFIAGKGTPKALENTTKAIGATITAFTKLGISADKAGAFVEGILDPDKFEENAYLFGRLGISVSDYSDMLLDAENGQSRLLSKIGKNLPALSREIKSIQSNPFAMRAFAKSLNMDMEFVQKLAKSSESEMESLMKEYDNKAQEDKAYKKKQEEQKAEAQKLDDQINAIKRKALAPLMNFVNKNLSSILNLFSNVSKVFSVVLKALVPILQEGSDLIIGFTNEILDVSKKVLPPVINIIKDFVAGISSFIKTYGPSFFKGFFDETIKIGSYIKDVFISIFNFIKPLANKLINMFPSFSEKEGKDTSEKTGSLAAYLIPLYLGFKTIKGAISFLSPRQKTVSNAKVGELADAIGESVAKHSNSPTQMGFFRSPIMKGLVTAAVATLAYKYVSEGIKEAGGSKRSEVMGGGAAAYYAGKFTMSGETLKAISDASNAKGFRGRIDAFKESKSLSKTLTELERVGVKNLDLSKNWQFTTKETKELFTKAYGKEAEAMFGNVTKQLKGAGLSGKVIPKAPPSGASAVFNEIKTLLSNMRLGVKASEEVKDVRKAFNTGFKGIKDFIKELTPYSKESIKSIKSLPKDIVGGLKTLPKDIVSGFMSPIQSMKNLTQSVKNAGTSYISTLSGPIKTMTNTTKAFAKTGGAIPTILADIAGGFAGEKIAEIAGGNEAQVKASGRSVSFLASTGAAGAYGGPLGMAINAAMIGAFKGFEDGFDNEEVNKAIIGPFDVAFKDRNTFDKLADGIQVALGGAMTLAIPYFIDDVATIITGEESKWGPKIVGAVSNVFMPLTAPIKAFARVTDAASKGFETSSKQYSSQFVLLNKKIDDAGKRMNDNIKKGDYFSAFSDIKDIMTIKFNTSFLIPIQTFFSGLGNTIIELLAGIFDKVNVYLPNFLKVEYFSKTREANKLEAIWNETITKAANSGNLETLRVQRKVGEERGYNLSNLDQIRILLEKDQQMKKDIEKERIRRENDDKKNASKNIEDGVYAANKRIESEKENEADKNPKDPYKNVIQQLLSSDLIRVNAK